MTRPGGSRLWVGLADADQGPPQLITAVAVLPGNAPDAQGALQLVAQSEWHTGGSVTATIADAAYGDGHTRQQFADAGRTLIAKVPKRPARTHFPKEDFQIDLAAGTCTCPAGQVTSTVRRRGFYATATAARAPRRFFHFDAALCTACPLRPRCVAAAPGRGRQVSLHPQEALLQAARRLQHSAAFAPYRHLRLAVEHRLARLVQLGLRRARYLGRHKTAAQLYLTATVANLTRILAATRTRAPESAGHSAFLRSDRRRRAPRPQAAPGCAGAPKRDFSIGLLAVCAVETPGESMV